MNTAAIIHEILKGYRLATRGDHGVFHWGRVLETGVRLAEKTGADREVVTLFALFHDARRVNEFSDERHGQRGAELAGKMRGKFFTVSDHQFELLCQACTLHTAGLTEGDVTVQVCWDADRLDLGRVGIRPLPERLCTVAARELLEWADARAVMGYKAEVVLREWIQP